MTGHNAWQAFVSMLVVGTVMGSYSDLLVPAMNLRDPLPLWALTPTTIAMIASSCVDNHLPTIGYTRGRIMVARGGWVACTLAIAALAGLTVAIASHQLVLVPATVALVALTFALSTVIGRGSAALGAGLGVLLIVATPDMTGATAESLLGEIAPLMHLSWIALGTLGIAVYVWRGSDSPVRAWST